AIISAVGEKLKCTIPPTAMFDYPTARRLAAHLAGPSLAGVSKSPGPQPEATFEPVAIIGMSGRFPQAESVEEFWQLLKDGRDAITPIPAARTQLSDAPAAMPP